MFNDSNNMLLQYIIYLIFVVIDNLDSDEPCFKLFYKFKFIPINPVLIFFI